MSVRHEQFSYTSEFSFKKFSTDKHEASELFIK